MKIDYKIIYFICVIIFILSLASTVSPYNSSRLHNTIYLYSTIANFISGLLFLIGGKRGDRDTLNTGFGIGIVSGILLIAASISGMNWNHSKLLQIDLTLKYAIIVSIKESSLFLYLLVVDATRRGFIGFNIGFYGALAQTFLSLSGIILGSIAFFLTNMLYWRGDSENIIFEYCRVCGFNLRSHYRTHCPNCGTQIRS